MKDRIMYIEDKSQGLSGPARIGLVSFSKTGRTLYQRGSVSVDDVESNARLWDHLAGVEPVAARFAPREDMASWPGKEAVPIVRTQGVSEGAADVLAALRYAETVATPAEHLKQDEVVLAPDDLTPAQRGAARLAWFAAQKGLGEPLDISVTAADTLAELRASAEV